MDDKQQYVEVSIYNDLTQVALLGSCIRQLASIVLDETAAYNAELCAVEAATNIIQHAYVDQAPFPGAIRVQVFADDNALLIRVLDSGKALDTSFLDGDHKSVFDFDDEMLETLPEGGMGLALILAVAGDVSYHRAGDENILTITVQGDDARDEGQEWSASFA